MKLTLFTVEEANRMVREIRGVMERLVANRRDLERLQRRIDVLELAVAGATPGNADSQELEQALDQRRRLADRLQRGLQSIRTRGAVVKDLERGLVDFYSIAGDRLIFLCWQLSEPEVSHWHPLEGGFASRQPLHRTERE